MKKMTTLAVLPLLVASCGGDGSIDVSEAWARTSPSMTTAGAVYMQITNTTDTDDVLLGATVGAEVAGRAEIHETTAMDGTSTTAGGNEMGSGGMMSMRPVDQIDVPASQTVSLEPGGYHVMLLDLAEPLEAGATITVTLTFEVAGDVEVEAEVRDSAP